MKACHLSLSTLAIICISALSNTASAVDYQTVWNEGYDVNQERKTVDSLILQVQKGGNYPQEAADLNDAEFGVWLGLFKLSTYMDWQNMQAQVPNGVRLDMLDQAYNIRDASDDTMDAAAALYFAATNVNDRNVALEIWFAAQRMRLESLDLIDVLENP